MKRITVGYIGWFAHDDTAFSEPRSVCDVNAEKVRQHLEKRPGTKGFTDYREMAADPGLDAVVISTPNWLHCEMAEAFLAAGKHVFCEKPMGVNRAEMDRMLRAQRASGKQLAIDFEMRVSAACVRFREVVLSGEIGKARGIEFVHHRGGWVAEGNGLWRVDPARSGGLYFMEPCHEVDYFRWLLGEVTHVQSFKFPNVLPHYPGNMPDNVTTHFFFEGGARGLILTSHALSAQHAKEEDYPAQGHDMNFVVYGTEGAARLDCIRSEILVLRHEEHPKGTNGRVVEFDRTEKISTPNACHDIRGNRLAFLRAVAEGRPHVQDARDAWRTHAVCLAAEASALGGSPKLAVDYTEP
jgi:predicted dehydrogenase